MGANGQMKKIDLYVHSSKEYSRMQGEIAGLTGDALEMSAYIGCEHKLTFEVDEKTGKAVLVSVDDRKLEPLECLKK